MKQDVAIIGVSGIFPEAENINEYYINLKNGRDSIREMPEDRIINTGLDQDKDYILCGYLNRIDEFDHEFFNISLREAEVMDPQQRFALQLACTLIENAGYSLKSFRGTNTSVIITAGNNNYADILDHRDGTVVVGNLISALAGKICYFLDLRGPSLIIDTSCSSSLVAVHEGCKKILTGESEYVIVGGTNISILFPEKKYIKLDPLGIASPDGKSMAFDKKANGTGTGEGVGMVLLKDMDKAVRDRDRIIAVIKGSAINNDANRSNGFGAPSSEAQTEVITRAWEEASIQPETISYIEAHGTGTKLGDPIEVKGLTDAFRKYTDKKSFCALSSVKTNIGHLGFAAGISAFIKVLLSLKYKELFPSLHFTDPNPHIDFDNSAVYINTTYMHWAVQDNIPRMAGVSSFGITGTNAHIVLEEYLPEKENLNNEKNMNHYLITLSAKNPDALQEYSNNLLAFIRENDVDFANMSYVLNKGRDDYDFRYSCVVKNKKEFVHTLSSISLDEQKQDSLHIVYLCSDDPEVKDEIINFFKESFFVFNEKWNELFEKNMSVHSKKFLFQYCMYYLLHSLGIRPSHVLGTGTGNIVVSVVTGKITLKEGLESAENYTGPERPFQKNNFINFLTHLIKDKKTVVCIELGNRGKFSSALAENKDVLCKDLPLFFAYTERNDFSFHSFLAYLYRYNKNINWDVYYKDNKLYRIELPTYPFRKKRCWPREIIRMNMTGPDDKKKNELPFVTLLFENPTETELMLAKIWGQVLKINTLSRDNDFFDLGGDSLMYTEIMKLIRVHFNMEIDFEDIYNYTTFGDFAHQIDVIKKENKKGPYKAQIITPAGKEQDIALSYSQESMYHLYKLQPASSFYNVPTALELKGSLDKVALEETINRIIQRHKILRTVYKTVKGKHYQSVLPNYNFKLPVINIQKESNTDELVKQLYKQELEKTFHLEEEIPLRSLLIEISDKRNILLVIIHHIAIDGWSLGVWIDDFQKIYTSITTGKKNYPDELPFQYIDYANWQRNYLKGDVLDNKINFWKKQLKGAPLLHKIPLDKKRPAMQTFNGSQYIFKIPKDRTDALKKLSNRENATLFVTLFACFNVLLYRISTSTDIVIGTPVAGRMKEGTENLIGFFINMLPLRMNISGEPGFPELLGKAKNVVSMAFSNQDLPFNKLLEVISPERNPGYSPLFQISFVLQNASQNKFELPGLEINFLTLGEMNTSRYDIGISLKEIDECLIGLVEYNIDIFFLKTIQRMMSQYSVLLGNVAKNPHQSISSISLMTEKEKEEILTRLHTSSSEEKFEFD